MMAITSSSESSFHEFDTRTLKRKVMKSLLMRITFAFALLITAGQDFVLPAALDTRTLEFPFALSADARSEFSAPFPVLSAGRIIIEANWSNDSQKSPVL